MASRFRPIRVLPDAWSLTPFTGHTSACGCGVPGY